MFQQIHLVPNPSIFTINDITIGVSATDVLMHINSLQFLKRMPCSPDSSLESTSGYISATQSSDPMSLLARHILEQRRLVRWFYLLSEILNPDRCIPIVSFYPIYPVPREQSSSVNLDVTHSHLLRMGVTRPLGTVEDGTMKVEEDQSVDESWDGSAPHILILPSRLKQFHRVSALAQCCSRNRDILGNLPDHRPYPCCKSKLRHSWPRCECICKNIDTCVFCQTSSRLHDE